jgi:hypothetical protein
MIMHFARAGVETILHALRTGTTLFRKPHDQKGAGKPQVWLVGNRGVYLMANNTPSENPFVVYANECNPTTMDFDAWDAIKRSSFGGDDSVEVLCLNDVATALATYAAGEDFQLDVNRDHLAIVCYRPAQRRPAPSLPDGFDRILADLVNQYIVVGPKGESYAIAKAGRPGVLIALITEPGQPERPINPALIPAPVKLGAYHHLRTTEWAPSTGHVHKEGEP